MSRVENMCATGTEALRGAAYAVASGAVDIALAIGAEKLKDTGYGGLLNVDRTVHVKKGSAKGVWHNGKRIATNSKNGKTYVVTGWVPASAFCA